MNNFSNMNEELSKLSPGPRPISKSPDSAINLSEITDQAPDDLSFSIYPTQTLKKSLSVDKSSEKRQLVVSQISTAAKRGRKVPSTPNELVPSSITRTISQAISSSTTISFRPPSSTSTPHRAPLSSRRHRKRQGSGLISHRFHQGYLPQNPHQTPRRTSRGQRVLQTAARTHRHNVYTFTIGCCVYSLRGLKPAKFLEFYYKFQLIHDFLAILLSIVVIVSNPHLTAFQIFLTILVILIYLGSGGLCWVSYRALKHPIALKNEKGAYCFSVIFSKVSCITSSITLLLVAFIAILLACFFLLYSRISEKKVDGRRIADYYILGTTAVLCILGAVFSIGQLSMGCYANLAAEDFLSVIRKNRVYFQRRVEVGKKFDQEEEECEGEAGCVEVENHPRCSD